MLMPQREELQRWFDENLIHFQQFIKFLEMMQRDLPEDTPEPTRRMLQHTIDCHHCNFYLADTELALARHEANTPHWEEPERQPSRSLLEARQEFSDIFAVADTLDEPVRTEFQDHLKQVKTRLDAALDD